MVSIAKCYTHGAATQVLAAARASNGRIIEEYGVMATEVGKVSHSGEEVLALKRLIAKCHTDQVGGGGCWLCHQLKRCVANW